MGAADPRRRSRWRSTAGSSRCPTSTRCCIRRPGSARPTSSTTSAGSPRCMLPHLAGRPPTLVRAPDGPAGEPVLREELSRPPSADGSTRVAGLRSDRRARAAASSRTSPRSCGSRTSPRSSCTRISGRWPNPEHPTAMVLDLDPGAPATIIDCCRVALDAARHARTTRLGVRGEDVGRQGTAPLGTAQRLPTRPTTRRRSSRSRSASCSNRAIRSVSSSTWRRQRRPGKVFVDWSQNDRHKTTVCAYSLRLARTADGLDADRLGRSRGRARRRRPDALAFEAADVLERVERARRPLRRLARPCTRSCPRSKLVAWISKEGRDRDRSVSRGVGAATAVLLAERGCQVVCAARATDDAPLPIPGTIDETVRRITDAGGDAIAVPTNLASRRRGRATWSTRPSTASARSTCS